MSKRPPRCPKTPPRWPKSPILQDFGSQNGARLPKLKGPAVIAAGVGNPPAPGLPGRHGRAQDGSPQIPGQILAILQPHAYPPNPHGSRPGNPPRRPVSPSKMPSFWPPVFDRFLDRFLAPLGAHLGPNLAPKTAPNRRKIDQKWDPDPTSVLASIFHRILLPKSTP